MKPPNIPLERVLSLKPACLQKAIPEAYRDENGHMNMRWFVALFDEGGDTLHERLGLTPAFHREHRSGTFDLEHHTHFLSEVNPGDRIAIYVRLVGQSPKRLHYLMFLVNETSQKLSSIFECMNAFADLKLRKTVPFPEEIAVRIREQLASDSRLDWPPPVSGSMQV
jgi:acyl-CoA thioester hydrolase